MAKHQNAIRVNAPIVFPINSGLLAFTAGSLLVGNNTAATIYVSNSQANPIPSGSNTVPPYTALPIYGFYGDQIYVGSDGATLRDSDSIGIDAFEEVYPAFPSVQITQPNYYDKPDPVYLGIGGVISTLNAVTTLATYTVPANKKTFIDALYLDIEVISNLSGGNEIIAFASLQQPVAGPILDLGRIVTYGTSKGTFAQMPPYSQIGMIGEGAVLKLIAQCDHTSGAFIANMYAKLTEFQA